MAIKTKIGNALNTLLGKAGLRLLDERKLYAWQRTDAYMRPGRGGSLLPDGAAEYLVRTNPRLVELERRYEAFDAAVTTPAVWREGFVSDEDLLFFRGDNPYVWQVRLMNMNEMSYALTTYYLSSMDTLGLLDKLVEDEFFGVHAFDVGGRLVSRDLLDSISDIFFLEKHLNLSSQADYRILDIGAGYGRLAHRLTEALPNVVEYLCTDAVAVSTFISEYYLRFRGIEQRAKTVPLDEIDAAMAQRKIDLAVNIQSFPECSIEAIDWWLSLLAKNRVRHLMIATNGAERLETAAGEDFGNLIEKHGYRLVVREPYYADPTVQKYAISSAWHHLFELGD